MRSWQRATLNQTDDLPRQFLHEISSDFMCKVQGTGALCSAHYCFSANSDGGAATITGSPLTRKVALAAPTSIE